MQKVNNSQKLGFSYIEDEASDKITPLNIGLSRGSGTEPLDKEERAVHRIGFACTQDVYFHE